MVFKNRRMFLNGYKNKQIFHKTKQQKKEVSPEQQKQQPAKTPAEHAALK